MRQLQRLYDMGELPDGLEPLFDDGEDGNGEIYGVKVMSSEDGWSRADIIEYVGFWKVMEMGMPGGRVAAREWKFRRDMPLADLAARIRAWAVDSKTSPEGWFEESHLSDARAQLIFHLLGGTEH